MLHIAHIKYTSQILLEHLENKKKLCQNPTFYLYNKALNIYMLTIAGPNGLTFFKGTLEYPGVKID